MYFHSINSFYSPQRFIVVGNVTDQRNLPLYPLKLQLNIEHGPTWPCFGQVGLSCDEMKNKRNSFNVKSGFEQIISIFSSMFKNKYEMRLPASKISTRIHFDLFGPEMGQ